MASKIEWTDETWNPVNGCTPVSPGCLNCYAAVEAHRWSHPHTKGPKKGQPVRPGLVGLTVEREIGSTYPPELGGGPDPECDRVEFHSRIMFNGTVRLVPERLCIPLRWKRARRVFVNSTSDLFHKDVPFEFIAGVYAIMGASAHHTFQVLTKRPARAAEFYRWMASSPQRKMSDAIHDLIGIAAPGTATIEACTWPLPNVWLGASVEDQKRADERIPHLIDCPAAIRFLSCEPLISAVDLCEHLTDPPSTMLNILARFYRTPNGKFDPEGGGRPYTRQTKNPMPIHWIIVGGESGLNARKSHPEWRRQIVLQAQAAGVPVFHKQSGRYAYRCVPDGHVSHACCIDMSGNDVAICRTEVGQLWMCRPGDESWNRVEKIPCGVVEWYRAKDPKGGDPEEWDADLRVREFPTGAVNASAHQDLDAVSESAHVPARHGERAEDIETPW